MIQPDLVDGICARLAEGESLVAICQSKGMPSYATVRRWLERGDEQGAPAEYVQFRVRYARAREEQADALADEMLDVARRATEKNTHAKRLLIDTLKWRASKLKPKVYGDRVEHRLGGSGGPPISIAGTCVDLSEMTDEGASRAYLDLIKGTR